MTPTVWVRAITVAAASCLLLIPGFGQSKGGATPTTPTGTGTTGSTGTPTNTPGRIGTPTTPNSTTTTPTQPSTGVPQPIYVSGRVTLEDGTPPPQPAVIETVCSGAPHGEGYTDAKGYFGIELGSRNNAMIQDASEMGSMSGINNPMMSSAGAGGTSPMSSGSRLGGIDGAERKYMGCDLQAKLAGYRSQQVSLTGRRPMDDPNVGVILLHRIGAAEEGQTVSMVSLAAPKDAKKAYDKGMDSLKKKKFDEAEKNFEKAVEAYPKYAAAWFELGMLQAGASKMDMARGYFNRALECDAKFIRPYLQLANLNMMEKRWQDLADVTDKTVKLDPFSYPQAYFFNSVANYNLHNLEEAEKSGLQAEHLDTRHLYPRVNYLLGLVAVQRKDYETASKRFKAYLQLDPKADDAATVRSQIEAIDKVTASAPAKNKDQQ
ncbi:MAG TPA: tetratricopeptide repeat protein [Candidatus Acidoferrales bacterium]|nr:tetratricopeptide repeat protein [Candidatus Acidoferrales bacterium]